MKPLLVIVVVTAGCAKAGPVDLVAVTDANGFGGHDGDNVDPIDAPINDAVLIDAGGVPVSLTLTQTQTTSIFAGDGNTVTCRHQDDGSSSDNVWYRAFLPSEQGITNAFNITQVTFAVEYSSSAVPATVAVGSYSGTIGGANLNLGMYSELATQNITIPATNNGELVPVPITATIPAGSALIAKVSTADFHTTALTEIGCTNSGETHPGYLTSVGCGVSTPSTPGSIGAPGSQLIITVTGTHIQ